MSGLASFVFLTVLGIAFGCSAQAPASDAGGTSIPFEQLGTEAQKQYAGDGISIVATPEGARLRAAFQKLEAEATREGLWLESMESTGKPERFRVLARGVGREGGAAGELAGRGQVVVTGTEVGFVRPGLIEEYRVSMDGVRQDFLVMARPGGKKELTVALEVTGAAVKAAADGVMLILDGSRREIAYSRLRVTDAAGRELQARMEVAGAGQIRICVDDAEAVYPVRIDPTFSDADWVSLNAGVPGTNGTVRAIALDAAGNLYIGGDFTVVGNLTVRGLARWNGSAWSALGTGIGGSVLAMTFSGSDLYVAGGGAGGGYAAKWNGSSWSSLGSGINGVVRAIAVSGTDVYIGGEFTKAGGEWANRVAKWNGTVWLPLGIAFENTVWALAVVGDRVYAGGDFHYADTLPLKYLAQWDGSSWSAVGSGISGSVRALVVKNSDLYVGGYFLLAGGVSARCVAKWDGSAWSALGGGVTGGGVNTLAISGNDVYVGGGFTEAEGVPAKYVAKWNGTNWSAMGVGPIEIVTSLAAVGSTVYMGGQFTMAGGLFLYGLAKWDGAAWSAATPSINGQVRALTMSGTTLYIGGAFNIAGGVGMNRIAKWDGSTWSALGTGMDLDVLSLAVNGNDLYAGGNFTTAGGVAASRVAKWNGSTWSALGAGMDGPVSAFAFMGTDVYAGGVFTTAGGVPIKSIAKWDGNTWSALDTGVSDVRSMVVSGNDLYVGGKFTTAGGITVNHIAKWDGTHWSALGVGILGELFSVKMMGNDLYVGGYFSAAGGIAANHVAKWDGTAWSPLGAGLNFGVHAMAVSGNDLYVGGAFTTAGGGVPGTNHIAKWSGVAWSALTTGVDDYVNAMVSDGDGHLFIGGPFIRTGTTVSPFIARANLPSGPEIGVEQPLGTSLADGGGKAFGNVDLGLSTSLTFTIQSLGNADLTGLTATIDGTDAGDFSITAAPAGSVSPAGSTSLTVAFTPGALGARTAVLHVTSNDGDENPYDITLTGTGMKPEIVVEQPAGTELQDGAGRGYGDVVVGSNSSLTFTIKNVGNLSLTGIAVTKDGTNSADFTVTASPTTSVAANGSTTFTVRFLPAGTGLRTAALHIASNDSDENPFDIVLTGTGLQTEIAVEQPTGTNIADAGSQGFGDVLVGSNVSLTFDIKNIGSANLTGLTITKDGTNSGDFTVTASPVAPVAPGGTTTFTVRFTPSAVGVRMAAIHIANNDSNENPFDITLTGSGVTPEIAVEQPLGSNIADAGSKSFGSVDVGSTNSLTFTIKNTGTGDLTGLTITKGGTNPGDFLIEANPAAPLPPSGSSTFTVEFAPSGQGARSATIQIANNDSNENPFDITLTGTGLKPEIAVEQPVGTNIEHAGSKGFGSVNLGTTGSLSFTLKNTGNVNLTGLAITMDGANAGDFNVTANPATSVAASGSTTFTVRFAPAATGVRTAALHIASNDSDENPFDITLTGTGIEPEMVVEQATGIVMASGEGRDFGSLDVGTGGSLNFTIKNIGSADLTGLTITKDGVNPEDFTITVDPSSPVVPNSSSVFTVQFSPSASGPRSAVLHLFSNDADESPFAINVTGTGLPAPEIVVEQPVGTNIVDSGSKSFGGVGVGATSSLTFTLKNTGPLELNGLAMTKDGANAGDFMVTALPVTLLGPGGSTTFTVEFTPSALGVRTAVIHIASNDPNENPFAITLTGTGTFPEIAVEQPVGTNIADGGSKSFGSTNVGSTASLVFTIKNVGGVDLTGLAITKDGAHAADFSVTANPASPVAASGSTTFTVQFAPSGTGARSAALHIASNDADENPFDITLTGTGIQPEIAVEQPAGTNIPDAGSKFFGSVAVGANISQTFTVRNTGSASLTGLTMTKDGTNAGEFAITTQPSGTVAVGGSTTFTVQFTPATRGSRSAALHLFSNDSDESPFDITLTGTGLQTEIVVEQPLGTGIIDVGSRSFGSVVIGSGATLSFVIRNVGDFNLTGLNIFIDGDHPGDFLLLTPATAPVLPDGSTPFVVRFSPRDVGVRTAFLHITSNDADESPFDITLTGQGEPSAISFDAATYSVDQGTANVTLKLTRENGSMPAAITLNTDDGTANKNPPFAAALAGFDYIDLTGAATRIEFAEGETEKTVQVPLNSATSPTAPNKRFTATLSNPSQYAALGATSTATIQMLASETTKPLMVLATPAAPVGGRPISYSKVSPYLVQGTAGDARGIDRVEVRLNGGDPVAATLGVVTGTTSIPASMSRVSFSLPIAPLPGLNTLVVTAYDLPGNSFEITRSFQFVQRYILTVARDTPTTAPDATGLLAMVATPASSATALSPTLANSNPQSSHIVPGTTVKLTATAKAGFLFNEWLGLSEDAAILGNTVTFSMPAADVALTADFISTTFAAPTGETNTFFGLIRPTGATVSSNVTEGFFTGTLTASGAFTGKVLIDGVSQPVTATYFGDGSAVFTSGAAKLSSLTFGGRVLTLSMNAGSLVAKVVKGANTSEGSARRLAYSTTRKVRPELLNSATKGFYTVSLLAKEQLPGMEPNMYPQGDGFATLSVSNVGVVSLTGTLADGSAITASSGLTGGDVSPVFVPLATPGGTAANLGGSFSGQFVFDETLGDSDVTAADLRWFRPAALGTKTLLYTAGWPGGIHVDAVGARYATTTKVQVTLGLGGPDAMAGNATLRFTEGKLASDVIKTKFNIVGNAVTKIAPVDGSYLLTLAPATGSFSGTFTPNWAPLAATKPAFKGILLQKGASAGGLGFFISNAKNDGDPESGSVILRAP